jgi:hypothetical protein
MKTLWIGAILVFAFAVVAVLLVGGYVLRPSETGFRIVSEEGNAVLISDSDVLSYNWTSQEITITIVASERLRAMGDSLYNFSSGFVVKIDGEDVYRGVFRTTFMSAVPSSPKISIIYPSVLFPSGTDNPNAIRLFFPSFEPPSDQAQANMKLSQHFQNTGKLSY